MNHVLALTTGVTFLTMLAMSSTDLHDLRTMHAIYHISADQSISVKHPVTYITVYAGPPPPSGTVHWMFWEGSLMSQALQCRQFWALICSRSVPCSSAAYSYTPAAHQAVAKCYV